PVGPVECLGPLTLVSRMPDGSVPLQGSSQWPAMSNAGLVAFQSNSPLTNLPSQSSQIFLRDIEGDITFLVSAAPDGSPGNNASMFPAITPTGSHVAFASRATNLVAGDSNARSDVFVAESCFTPGCVPTITRVSVNSAGEQQSGGFDDIGFQPVALSDDGRYVAFSSSATRRPRRGRYLRRRHEQCHGRVPARSRHRRDDARLRRTHRAPVADGRSHGRHERRCAPRCVHEPGPEP